MKNKNQNKFMIYILHVFKNEVKGKDFTVDVDIPVRDAPQPLKGQPISPTTNWKPQWYRNLANKINFLSHDGEHTFELANPKKLITEEEQEIIVAFTTEIYRYPNHNHLRGHLWGAKKNTIKKWMDEWSGPVEKFCKENNISHIETAGRDGWTRVLQSKGYKKYY